MVMMKTTTMLVGKSVVRRASRAVAAASKTSRTFSVAASQTDAAARCLDLEDKYGAHNYHPLPVVLSEGKGMLLPRGVVNAVLFSVVLHGRLSCFTPATARIVKFFPNGLAHTTLRPRRMTF